MGHLFQLFRDFFEDRFEGGGKRAIDFLIGLCAVLVLVQFLRGCSSEGGVGVSLGALVTGFSVMKVLVLLAVLLLVLTALFGIQNDEDSGGDAPALRSRRSGKRMTIIAVATVLGLLALLTDSKEEPPTSAAAIAPGVATAPPVHSTPRAAPPAAPTPTPPAATTAPSPQPQAATPVTTPARLPSPAPSPPSPTKATAAESASTRQAAREMLVRELEDLQTEARRRWRKDIESADATGSPGVVPPMISVTQTGDGTFQVKNLSSKTACVRLGRVAQAQAGGAWVRCSLDVALSCHEIRAGQTRRFVLGEGGHATGCRNSKLEYRIGTPLNPDPSWWSRTALQDYDLRGDGGDRAYLDWTVDHLRAEISILQEMLEEQDRAARWRRELGGGTR